MSLTLSIVDNGDGTGATATIAGSDAGSANTVWVQSPPDLTWTSAGSRTGNGTVTLAVANGYYFAYVLGTLVSTVPNVSPVTNLFVVTSSSQSVLERSMNAAKAIIQAIAPTSLTGFTAANVSVQWALDDESKSFPHIFLIPYGSEQDTGGTNLRDDLLRPFRMVIVDRTDERYEQNFSTILLWRQRLMKVFHNHRLVAVTENMTCTVQPEPVVQWVRDKFQYLLSSFIVQPESRETREV